MGTFLGALLCKTLIIKIVSGEGGSRTYIFKKYHKIANC